jgi:hypothetical protein
MDAVDAKSPPTAKRTIRDLALDSDSDSSDDDEPCEKRQCTTSGEGSQERKIVLDEQTHLALRFVVDCMEDAVDETFIVPDELAEELLSVYEEYGHPGDLWIERGCGDDICTKNQACKDALNAAFKREMARYYAGTNQTQDMHDLCEVIQSWQEVSFEDKVHIFGKLEV